VYSAPLERAARILRGGGVIAYPTEAVYGIGCVPLHEEAVLRVLRIKGRSWRKGLLLIAASVADLEPYVHLPPEPRRSEVLDSWPGPVTWVLQAKPGVPDSLTGGRATLGVRVTDHPIARALCERVGAPLVSTSANFSRRPPLRSALRVRRLLGPRLDGVLGGPVGGLARPTVIRDGATGEVLRGA
jgi:L-threonylcarbamoyladenylate synthase